MGVAGASGSGGGSVTLNHDDNGRWSVGVGSEVSVPGFTGSVTQDLGSGNVDACVGPNVGLPLVMGVSPQHCWTVDHDRARETREAIAYGQRIAQQNAQAASSSGGVPPQAQSYQDAYQAYQQMLNQVRNDPNVYNNPFAPNGRVSVAPVPDSRFQPGAGAPVGMSQDQFRASVNQSMQQFRQADAQSRQGSGQQPFPGTGSAAGPGATVGASAGQQSGQRIGFDDNAPRNTSTGQGPQQYAPRNGYDAQGNRADSPRNQYDAQGNRADSPRNQYDPQGYRQDSPRSQYDAQGNRADSTRPRSEPQGNPQSLPAPVTPNVPAVSQRAYGTQSQTAALHFPGK